MLPTASTFRFMTNDFRLAVGQRIRSLREAAGYRNQGEFAKLLGKSPSELSRLERGLRKLDTLLLREIALKLDVPMEAFFPEERHAMALARQGDADESGVQDMVSWALDLRKDLDQVADYAAGRPR